MSAPAATQEHQIDSIEKRGRLYVFSAHDEQTGKKIMANLSKYLRAHSKNGQQTVADDLAYTLAERRSMLSWRGAVPGFTTADLADRLETGSIKFSKASGMTKFGFLFTGQGAQWPAMGLELFEVYPSFRETFMKADQHLRKLQVPWSLKGVVDRLVQSPRTSERPKS